MIRSMQAAQLQLCLVFSVVALTQFCSGSSISATRVAVLTDHRVMQRAPPSGSSMGITGHTMPQ